MSIKQEDAQQAPCDSSNRNPVMIVWDTFPDSLMEPPAFKEWANVGLAVIIRVLLKRRSV